MTNPTTKLSDLDILNARIENAQAVFLRYVDKALDNHERNSAGSEELHRHRAVEWSEVLRTLWMMKDRRL